MPSVYHEHCGKPGPKSNDYIPPPEARIFKSRSAPSSPCLERKPLFPRSPRLTRSPKLARAESPLSDGKLGEKLHYENKNPRTSKIVRSRSFGASTRGIYITFHSHQIRNYKKPIQNTFIIDYVMVLRHRHFKQLNLSFKLF